MDGEGSEMKWLLSVILAGAGCFAVYTSMVVSSPAIRHSIDIEGVESIGELGVLCVSVSERLTASTSKTRLDYLIVGDAIYTVDFSRISKSEKDGRTVISLPLPKLVHPRVDMSRSRQYDASTGLFVKDSNLMRARSELLARAQKLVEQQAGHERFLLEAKAEAVRTLESLLPASGFDVAWLDP